ncbi:MAG TPA: hypothetical protein VII06_32210 [Chloroflexota bacterium]
MVVGTVAKPAARPARAQRRRAPPALVLPDRYYWPLAGAIVVLFLLAWVAHFRYVYGWVMDDRGLFLKGLDTVRDWHGAFTYYNALHAFFFLISWLPLKSGLALPSYPLPTFGAQTGQFRFFLLYVVFLHAGLLLVWAWFATVLTRDRLIALLSLLLFATSPTLMLWTPQPESRLLGLPFALLGLWLLLRLEPAAGSARGQTALLAFGAGSLFGVSQSIHYTALYLIAPLCLVYWAVALWHGWRRGGTRLTIVAFGLGGLWLHGLLEAVSYYSVGIPLDHGPTATLLELRTMHTSPWSRGEGAGIFAEGFLSQMGPLLLLAMAAGWVLYARGAPGLGIAPGRRGLIGASIPLALGYLLVSGTMPFFRQTSVLQPFLFLFAACAVVAGIRRFALSGRKAWAALGLLLVLVGGVQWAQAAAVFAAHEGLGRALEWANTQKGNRPLVWLPIAWYDGTSVLDSAAEIAQANPDSWIVSYFPWRTVRDSPSLQPSLETASVASWSSLYATDTLRYEEQGYGYHDFRSDPVLRDVRLIDAGALRAALHGTRLAVRAVTADSQAAPNTEAGNVFDHDRAPDHNTAWLSAGSPMPHFVDIELAEPTAIGSVQIVLPTGEQTERRIGALDVQAEDSPGELQTVWSGDGLDRYPVITATWEPRPTSRLRFVVRRQTLGNGADTPAAEIEEIVFPGYDVVAPLLQRPLPELRLDDVLPTSGGLLVRGANLTRHTSLVLDDQTVPLRAGPDSASMLARLPASAAVAVAPHRAYLTDGLRESNSLTLSLALPTARRAP